MRSISSTIHMGPCHHFTSIWHYDERNSKFQISNTKIKEPIHWSSLKQKQLSIIYFKKARWWWMKFQIPNFKFQNRVSIHRSMLKQKKLSIIYFSKVRFSRKQFSLGCHLRQLAHPRSLWVNGWWKPLPICHCHSASYAGNTLSMPTCRSSTYRHIPTAMSLSVRPQLFKAMYITY